MEAALKKSPNLGSKAVRVRLLASWGDRWRSDEINRAISEGKTDFQGLKLNGITVEALMKGFVAEMPKLMKAAKKANLIMSANNTMTLHKSLQAYKEDNDKLPTADQWCDAILKDYLFKYFYSPQHPDIAELIASLPKGKRVSHYALNKAMAGKATDDGDKVLVFECDLGWNGVGGLKDALMYMEKHKLEKIAVSLANGAPRQVTREDLKKLKW
jgi:hypothetical protein